MKPRAAACFCDGVARGAPGESTANDGLPLAAFTARWISELLPFPPTGDQGRAFDEIDGDLASELDEAEDTVDDPWAAA